MSGTASSKRRRGVVRAQTSDVGAGAAHEDACVQRVPTDRIDIPARPARRFLGDLAALADSMQAYGLQQPISVRAEGGRFLLTSGLRRLSAARILQWTSIPAFVRTVSADHAYLLDLIENLQREDLSPEEEADALGELIRTRGWTLQQVADSVKRSVAYVSKRVRVFEDRILREAIAERGLPLSTAEELLAADPQSRAELIEQALAERWDQVRARDAVRAAGPPQAGSGRDGAAGTYGASGNDDTGSRPRQSGTTARVWGVRPKGLTRAVREFHALLMGISSEHLTHADRAALRALFRDLVLIARAPATPRQRVFPALPDAPAGAKRSRTRRVPKTRAVSAPARRTSARA
ncbi:MAG: ParB/RepB/Spo0J family partition protein [Chloroflexota bacterium]|nr:ParB/RepB/Spo0J family partition protein [Chloroflexota bacterium]